MFAQLYALNLDQCSEDILYSFKFCIDYVYELHSLDILWLLVNLYENKISLTIQWKLKIFISFYVIYKKNISEGHSVCIVIFFFPLYSLELVYNKGYFNLTKIFVLRLFKMVAN